MLMSPNCTLCRYLEEEWRHLRKNPHSDISVSETIGQDIPWNIHKEKVEVSVHDG
jgi:ubiquitin-like-specific protease 1C/D